MKKTEKIESLAKLLNVYNRLFAYIEAGMTLEEMKDWGEALSEENVPLKSVINALIDDNDEDFAEEMESLKEITELCHKAALEKVYDYTESDNEKFYWEFQITSMIKYYTLEARCLIEKYFVYVSPKGKMNTLKKDNPYYAALPTIESKFDNAAPTWHLLTEEQQDDGEEQLPDGLNPDTTATGKLELPSELDKDRAQKHFQIAIDKGWMEQTGQGGKRKWTRLNSQLGYFVYKTYDEPRPINALEEYFGVKKLSTNITNAQNPVRRSDAVKWRNEIDTALAD